MAILHKLSKIPSRISRFFILKLEYIHPKAYRKKYYKWLKKRGVIFAGMQNYISNSAYLDGHDFSMLSLGEGCTISRNVILLTHDYSQHTVLGGDMHNLLNEKASKALAKGDAKDLLLDMRRIHVGNHSFIGAGALLLPGTHIGDHSIVGAGAVVKGTFPDYSIIVGNPGRVVANTIDWLNAKGEKLE